MQATVNITNRVAAVYFDLTADADRANFIAFLNSVRPHLHPIAQFQVDKCIVAAGGVPTPAFPGYEAMTQ